MLFRSAVFKPKQIGQLEKIPSIPNYYVNERDIGNVCDCLEPKSYTRGRLITVRGTMIGDLSDEGQWGWKLFLGDGTGIAQVFIDGASDSYVERIKDTMLVHGTGLCVTGLVAQIAGTGWELLPRTEDDIELC